MIIYEYFDFGYFKYASSANLNAKKINMERKLHTIGKKRTNTVIVPYIFMKNHQVFFQDITASTYFLNDKLFSHSVFSFLRKTFWQTIGNFYRKKPVYLTCYRAM